MSGLVPKSTLITTTTTNQKNEQQPPTDHTGRTSTTTRRQTRLAIPPQETLARARLLEVCKRREAVPLAKVSQQSFFTKFLTQSNTVRASPLLALGVQP
jgi:hypothetical protein